MNLLLLDPTSSDELLVDERQHKHLRDVLRVQPGDTVRVGHLGGRVGKATVIATSRRNTQLRLISVDEPPPSKNPMTLVLALCRPPVLKRVIASATAMGVKRVVVVGARRVEKSFWTSSAVTPAALRQSAILGLEQSRDTILPHILLRPRFRPFVEDELADLATAVMIAHPSSEARCPCDPPGELALVIGPEGGWIPFETRLFRGLGFSEVSLGPRPLRTETAATALLGRLIAGY